MMQTAKKCQFKIVEEPAALLMFSRGGGFLFKYLTAFCSVVVLSGVFSSAALAQEMPAMIRFSIVNIEYGKLPFKISVLDTENTSFRVSPKANWKNFEVSNTDIIYSGGGVRSTDDMGNTISVSVKTLSPEASFKISSRCNNRDDWTPVRMRYLGRPDNVISNDFNPPDNVGTGTLDFSESRDSFASRSIEVNNAGVGGIGDDYEDSNSRRVSHGFLDLYSFLILGGGFIIGVVIVYLLIVFVRKRQ